MKAKRQDLVGRKIVAVHFGTFQDGRGGSATKPILILDNGKQISFTVQETDMGDYGVRIDVWNPKQKKAAKGEDIDPGEWQAFGK